MKRITAILLAVLVFGLTACAPQKDGGGVTATTTVEQITTTTTVGSDETTTTATVGTTTKPVVGATTTEVVTTTARPVETTESTTATETTTTTIMTIQNTTTTQKGTTTMPLAFINKQNVKNGIFTYDIVGSVVTITKGDMSAKGKVVIPSTLEGFPVRHIGDWAFINCNEITEVIIPDSVISIGEVAFYSDYLTSVHIPSGVENLGFRAFSGNNIMSYTVSPDNQAYAGQDEVLFSKDMTILIAYPIGKAGQSYKVPESVHTVEEKAFATCQNLREIHFATSVRKVKQGAFWGCQNLESVHLTKTDGMVFEKEAFYNCNRLTEVYCAGLDKWCVQIHYEGNDCFKNATWHYNAK